MATATAPAKGAKSNSDKKKTKKPKVKYREDSAPKIKGIPSDWQPSKHLPLSKADFEVEADYYDFKAARMQASADRFRSQAELCRQFGNEDQRKAAAKLEKARRSMQEMQAKLEAELGPEAVQQLLARMEGNEAK